MSEIDGYSSGILLEETEPGLLSLLFFYIGTMEKMKKKASRFEGNIVRRKVNYSRIGIILLLSVVAFFLIAFSVNLILKNIIKTPSTSKLQEYWSQEDYQQTYLHAETILQNDAFNSTALSYLGYSSFYLAISQTDPTLAQNYLNQAINSLRIALLYAPEKTKPQIEYMLGKSYYHKNVMSAYIYYYDLAIFYLKESMDHGYYSSDIYEYLGLSYAALSMTLESIASFTQALEFSSSEILLLAIAQQYYNNNQPDAAKPYLFSIKNSSTNEINVLKCANLLAQIYVDEGNLSEALTEYQSVLEKDPSFADAYYGIGNIYEKQGDLIKARAEWRKALKLQVNHSGAMQKLGY